MNLYQTFSTIIDRYYAPNTRIVLAFSGGVDSRVLLDLLAQYKDEKQADCLAVYVHHGLSSNADDWLAKCQTWAIQSGIDFIAEHVQLNSNGESLEACAREARYQALRQHLDANDLLLTGQHSDDQVETFLLALKRGSGPKGLSGMGEATALGAATIVRPLLSVSRAQIEHYALQQGLQWVEDESNQDTRFDRNFIRHQISPLLTQRWPHFAQSVNRSAQLCAEQELLIEELLQDKLQAGVAKDGSLDITLLSSVSELSRARLIRMWLAQQNIRMPSREHLGQIWHQVALAKQDANPSLNLADGQVRRFSNRLYTVTKYADITDWQSTVTINQALSLPDNLGYLLLKSCSAGHLSQHALAQGDLKITFNPEGLSAHPAERGHSRKLKKLFQEYGVPSWQRRRMPILMCGDNVAAIADLFIDHQFTGQDCELIWDKCSIVV